MPNLLFIMISIITWGLGFFLYKIALNNINALLLSGITTILYIFFLPIAFIIMKPNIIFNISGIIVGLIGAICIGIGTIAYYLSIQNSNNVGMITVITGLYPIVTLLLSILFLNESINLNKIIACVLICISFFLMIK